MRFTYLCDVGWVTYGKLELEIYAEILMCGVRVLSEVGYRDFLGTESILLRIRGSGGSDV